MIQFDKWRITNTGALLARQYDHLTRELRVVGELPDGWSWDVLVQAGKRLDIIRLSPAEGGLSVTLTAEMLALGGYYAIQLRGIQGEQVRHTNVIQVYVGPSLSGDAQWPTIPTEFTQLEQRVQASAAEAQASAEAAAQSAQDAETAAQDAADQTAQQLQSKFEALAKEASDSAQSAEASAQSASTAAGSAAQSASAAWASANQAAASAQSAAAASSAAAQSASGATDAAGTAQSAATQAQQSAESASKQAQTAGDHAADADQSAKSAADAQASAETAAGNAEQSANAAAQSAQEAEAAAENAKTIIDDTTAQLGKTWSSLTIVDRLAPAFESSGPVVTCNPVKGYPLNVVSQIVPVQEGSGDPSPENVRPISGWDEADLWVGGANMLEPLADTDGKETVISGITFQQNNCQFNITGTATNYGDRTKAFCKAYLPKGTYTISADGLLGSGVIVYLNNAETNEFIASVITSRVIKQTFSISNPLTVNLGFATNPSSGEYNFTAKIMLEVGSEVTAYEPYRGQTITLPFGQTVYGGTLDWTTGVLTVASEKFIVNSVQSYADRGETLRSGVLLPNCAPDSSAASNYLPYIVQNVLDEPHFYIAGTTAYIYLQKSWLTNQSLEGINEYLANNPLELLYNLAEHITIQLTPKEILALSGTNTLYTDTGDTTVSGRADPNAIIQQLAARIAALEGAATNL